MAATPSVGTASATFRFLESITFRGSATLTPDVIRAELVIDFEGSSRSEVVSVPRDVATGSTTLFYVLDTPAGSIVPNTDVTARFRLTLQDGSSVLGRPTTVHYDDTRYQWKTMAGEFVIVHWTEGGDSFGRRARQIGDDAVRDVGELLGVTETESIDFYVYSDRTAFYDVLGPAQRENVGGTFYPGTRTLLANIAPNAVDDPWVRRVITHELTHLVFDTAVTNPYHYPPRWLNEGIAVYLAQGYDRSDRGAVRDAVGLGTVMPLSALGGLFPTTHERFSLAYSESVSAVSFLVDQYGRGAMVALVRSYADGVTDDEAFQSALGTDVAGFEAAWLESIGASAPIPFGPRPAPAGPVPSGWVGAAPIPGIAPGAPPSPTAVASPTGASPDPAGGLDESVRTESVAVLAMTILAILFLARRAGRRRVDRLPAVGAAANAPGQELPPGDALPDEISRDEVSPDDVPPAAQEPPA
jgi:hypothetical protein